MLHVRSAENTVSRPLQHYQNFDPRSRTWPPGGSRQNNFYILEQGEYEGEKGFWVEDEDGNEDFMGTEDEETFWVLEDPVKKCNCGRGGFNPFKRSNENGKAHLAKEHIQDPHDQAYWGEGQGKKSKK